MPTLRMSRPDANVLQAILSLALLHYETERNIAFIGGG